MRGKNAICLPIAGGVITGAGFGPADRCRRARACARAGLALEIHDDEVCVEKTLFAFLLLAALSLAPVSAQQIDAAVAARAHAQNEASPAPEASMGQMNMDRTAMQPPSPHEGSGTAWQ